jgi:hypothetical protein
MQKSTFSSKKNPKKKQNKKKEKFNKRYTNLRHRRCNNIFMSVVVCIRVVSVRVCVQHFHRQH